MSGTESITLGPRRIGPGEPAFIIAEAGVNHDGDLDAAIGLVDAAAAAGADAVKFQTFDAAELVTADSALADYQRAGEREATSQRAMLARLELDRAAHERLAARAAERGIVFLSTPFDSASADLLAGLGVPAFKVGSGELTNLPLLTELAAHRLPILLSTGMADLDEVSAAAETLRAGGAPFALLHCVSSYPAPPSEANLRAIATLRERFAVPVGYSDHCPGIEVAIAAVAAGACVLERHLTLDRHRPGPDHAISSEPAELAELVRRVRALEPALGDGQKRPQPSERELRVLARRSIRAVQPLSAGDRLEPGMLATKRPGEGLAPARLESVLGRRLARALGADEALTDEHLA